MKLMKEIAGTSLLGESLMENPFASIAKGWNSAKEAHAKKDAHNKSIDDAEAAANAPVDPNNIPFEKNDVLDDLHVYVDNFFKDFPNYGEGGAEYFLKTYPQQAARDIAEDAFKKLAKQIDALRVGFNKSLVSGGRLDGSQIKDAEKAAKKQMTDSAPPLDQSFIDFVKRESAFFRKLIKIKGDGVIDESTFAALLGKKVANTGANRIMDATTAINILLGYMSAEFTANADHMAKAREAGEDEARQNRLLNRTVNQNPAGG